MGIFKNIIKKVALAAAVVAGKRILSKVVTDVIDGDKKPAEVPVTPAVKPKSSSNRRRAPAKPKSEGAKSTSRAAKPKATGANNASATDTPKKPTKPRTRKPRAAAQPKSSENKADVASTPAASHSSQSDTE